MQKIWEERFPFEWVDLRYVGNEQSTTPLAALLPGAGGTLVLSQMSQLGFTALGSHLYPVKLGGWHNQAGRMYLSRCLLRPEMIVALAERTEISTAEELRPLLVAVQDALQQLQFCGTGFQFSVFGRKPFSTVPLVFPKNLLFSRK